MPITPEEVIPKRKNLIPNEVFEVFDDLIVKNFSGTRAMVMQDVVVGILEDRGFSRQQLYDNHYLDVEPYYREAGWQVTYNKKCIGDSFDSHYIFQSAG